MTDLDESTIEALLQAARKATSQAYVPYSSYPVGAAVLTGSGEIVSGVNIENASFGLTMCGERVAIFTAAAMGHRTIRAVAVVAIRAKGVTPCGACRQVINEFKPEGDELSIVLDGDHGPIVKPFSAYLPHAFGPRDLQS